MPYQLEFVEQPLTGIGDGLPFEEALAKRVFWFRSTIQPGNNGWLAREDGHLVFRKHIKTCTVSAAVGLVPPARVPPQKLWHIPLHFEVVNYNARKVDGKLVDLEVPTDIGDGTTPPVLLSDRSESLSLNWDESAGQYHPARFHFRIETSSHTKPRTNRPYFRLRVSVPNEFLAAQKDSIIHVDSQPFIVRSKKNRPKGSVAPAMVTCFGNDPTAIADVAREAGKLGPETSRRKLVLRPSDVSEVAQLRREVARLSRENKLLRRQLKRMGQ